MKFFENTTRLFIWIVFIFTSLPVFAQTQPQFSIQNPVISDASTTVGNTIKAACDAKMTGTQSTIIKLVMGWARDGETITESKRIVWIGSGGQTALGLSSSWTPTGGGTYTCWIFMAVAVIDSQAIAAFPANPAQNANTKLVGTIQVTAPVSTIKESSSITPSPLVRNITAECDVKVSGPKGTLIRLVMGWTLEGKTISESLQVVWTGLDGGTAQKLDSAWSPTVGGVYTCWIYPAWAATDSQAIEQFSPNPSEDSKAALVGNVFVYLTSLYWQKLSFNESPSSSSTTLSYDPTNDQAVFLLPTESQMETWLYSGSEWQRMRPILSPGFRTYGTMSYLPNAGIHVLFGGQNKDKTPLSETWVYDVKQNLWSQKSIAVSPPPSATPTMVCDEKRNVLVLIVQPESENTTGSTWEFDGTTWKKTDAGGPGLLTDPVAAYDPIRQRIVLFSSPSQPVDKKTTYDVWEYDGTQWVRTQLTSGPDFQYGVGAVYVPDLDGVMFVGNQLDDDNLRMNGWLWKDGNWERADFVPAPTPRSTITMFYQPDSHRVVLFGGSRQEGELPETWILKRYDQLTVRNVKSSLSPAIVGKLMTAQCDAYVSGPADTTLKLVMGWSRDGIILPDSLQMVWTGMDGTLAENLNSQWQPQTAGEYSCWIHLAPTDSDSLAIGQVPKQPVEEAVTQKLNTVFVPENDLTISRSFQPSKYQQAKAVQVNLQIQPKSDILPEAVVVEEKIPEGLVPSDISDAGKYISSQQIIRWFFVDDFRSRLSYTLMIPAESVGEFQFTGDGQCTFQGKIETTLTLGETVLRPADCILSLDADADSMISADELLVGAYQWKQGQTTPSTVELLLAAGIWKQGGAYQCDGNGNFILAIPQAKSFLQRNDIFFSISDMGISVQATRELPQDFTVDSSSQVKITMTIQGAVDAIAVEETVPLGWKVSNVSNNGTYEAGSHSIRWFLLSAENTILTYSIESTAYQSNDFAGTISWVIGAQVEIAPLNTVTGIEEWRYY